MYTSTIDIVIGHDEIVNGDESTPPPNRHLFPGYNETKRKAEEMVITIDDLHAADELFVGNSVRGLERAVLLKN